MHQDNIVKIVIVAVILAFGAFAGWNVSSHYGCGAETEHAGD